MNYEKDMKITKNFLLSEFLVSQTAVRRNIDNTPNEHQIKSIIKLCSTILQPIRNYYNMPLVISSGFRSNKLNKAIGGSKTSQHCKGEAADFTIDVTKVSLSDQFKTIACYLELDYDQLIYEYGRWIHVSHKYEGIQRKEILIARKNKFGKTIYSKMTKDNIIANF